MGVSLGYTILHRVPNDFHGLHLKNPSINVDIPDVGIGIGLGGNVIKIKMPKNQLNLGEMPAMDASFNTDESDRFQSEQTPGRVRRDERRGQDPVENNLRKVHQPVKVHRTQRAQLLLHNGR